MSRPRSSPPSLESARSSSSRIWGAEAWWISRHEGFRDAPPCSSRLLTELISSWPVETRSLAVRKRGSSSGERSGSPRWLPTPLHEPVDPVSSSWPRLRQRWHCTCRAAPGTRFQPYDCSRCPSHPCGSAQWRSRKPCAGIGWRPASQRTRQSVEAPYFRVSCCRRGLYDFCHLGWAWTSSTLNYSTKEWWRAEEKAT